MSLHEFPLTFGTDGFSPEGKSRIFGEEIFSGADSASIGGTIIDWRERRGNNKMSD